ncbi:MAG: hypothetical protein WC637_08110 [Victivallales bacterium]|jgi:hypothetical protein
MKVFQAERVFIKSLQGIGQTAFAIAGLLLSIPLSAATIGSHFDSPEEISQFNPQTKDPSAIFENSKMAAGAGCIKATSFHREFKEDWPEGVMSFWVYDDSFEEITNHKLRTVNISLLRNENGKRKAYTCEIRRHSEGWRVDLNDSTQTARYIPLPDAPNHGGWTRFDIVNPAGPGAKQFTVYIDGHKAFTTPGKYDFIGGFSLNNLPYADEFTYDSNPANFHPNPVRGILPKNPYGQVLLNPGEKLKVELDLDRRGARATSGELSVTLLDGRGETLVTDKVKIDWDKSGGQKFNMELPTAPRSGNFWLETRYQEPGCPVETTRRKLNLQFLSPKFAQADRAPLELFRHSWDFIPLGKIEPIISGPAQASGPTKEDLSVPAAPPADWSKAIPLKGAWVDLENYFNIGCTAHAGWYHQRVDVPASWQGQKIMLEIEAPETIATVFANGKRAGALEWPGGNMDLTAFASAGKQLDLAIHVKADPVYGYYKLCRETMGEKFEIPRYNKVRGLSGDVCLFPAANGPRIDGVAIRPSVSKKKLSAVFELINLVPGKPYLIKAAASAAGKIAKAFPETTFTAKSANDTVEISVTWADPVLWDLNAPYLYDLDAILLDAAGKNLDTLWPERFGFREVTGTGPDLLLNGRPVTLFITSGGISDTPDHSRWCEKFGFSAFYMGEGKDNGRLLDEAGKTATGERLHREAVLLAPLDMAKNGKDDDQKLWVCIDSILEKQNKVRRNHPGVFFQRGLRGGGRLGNGGMYNPYFQNGTWVNEPRGNDVSIRAAKACSRILDKLHRLDPTRLVTAQDSGSMNDTMHITEYAGFLPMQEMIEKTQYWRKYGSKPFLIEEQAAPMFPNWTDACSQGKGWNGVPCFGEWSAITRGDDAYARTPLDGSALLDLEKSVAQQRQKVVETVKNPLERDVAIAKIRMTSNFWPYNGKDEVMHNIIWKERIRDEVLNWRANNLGMLGFFFSNFGPRLDLCYMEYQAPVTGFLAGTKDKPTVRTHIFKPGETMERGALLLNNSHKPDALTCEWNLVLNGETVSKGSKTETVPAGGQVFVPITAAIPAGGDRSGKLTVNFIKDGKPLRSDNCDIDVVAPRTFENRGRIALVDPEGDSAKAMDAAGIKYQPMCFDEDFSPFDTVVFGRRAFNYEFSLLSEGLDLAALLRQGKRVLIMEQDEQTLRDRFKLRTEYVSPRDVYGRIGGSAILDGLPDRLLKSWRGHATLTDGYAVSKNKGKPNQGEFGNGGTWLYNWNDGLPHPRPMKWGNNHNVATVVVIKPDTGNFRTLLDCEYASNYAAAWELEGANSRIVFNQLDVSGRSESDPAAVRYLQNLLRYTQTVPAPKWRQAAYIGGDRGAALLTQVDVPFRKLTEPSMANPAKDVLVVGDAAPAQLKEWKDSIAKFATAGGTVFSLPRSEADFAANWTPFPVTAKKRTVNHTLVGKPSAPLLAGLGNSDFYWKGNINIVSLEKAVGSSLLLDTGVLAEIPCGKGYVFCQIEPSMFGDINRDHWLKPSKHNTERTVRTLLSNSGVAMSPPKLLAPPKAKEELDRTIDLAGKWKVHAAKPGDTVCPARNAPGWRDITLPGSPQKAYPEWQGVKGAFWYRSDLNLEKELPGDSTLRLLMGRISGSDILFVNGVKAAWTNTETDVNAVAAVIRDYPLSANLFKQGANELSMLVEYDTNAALGMKDSTGEIAAPMDLKIYKMKTEGKIPAPIDLSSTSEWWGHTVKDASEPWKHSIRQRLAVPAYIQPQRVEWSNMTGYFWYWHEFKLKEPLPEGVQPVLMIGAVDDEDTAYFNGVKIGHTGKDTNPDNYWMAPRAYPVPQNLFKVGNNVITIQIHDLNVGGGICAGPVQIIFEDPELTRKRKLAESPYIHNVGRTDDPYWHHGF